MYMGFFLCNRKFRQNFLLHKKAPQHIVSQNDTMKRSRIMRTRISQAKRFILGQKKSCYNMPQKYSTRLMVAIYKAPLTAQGQWEGPATIERISL